MRATTMHRRVGLLLLLVALGPGMGCERQPQPARAREEAASGIGTDGTITNEALTDEAEAAALEAFYGPAVLAQARTLDSLFQDLIAAPTPASCRAFLDAQPTSFEGFRHLYGYPPDSVDGPFGPLYTRSDHLDTLFAKAACIGPERLATWAIGVAAGGDWQADNVNFFQNHLDAAWQAQPQRYCLRLHASGDDTARAFWFFLFAGPHPPEELPEAARTVLETSCPDQLPLARQGLEAARHAWDDGHGE